MNLRTVVVLLVVALAGLYVWKRVGSNVERTGSVVAAGPSSDRCVDAAAEASGELGASIGKFVNPPVDQSEWDTFASRVNGRISAAEAACACVSQRCARARGAVTELRSVVSSLDAAARSGGSVDPSIVQRQEAIDDTINEARSMQ